MVVGPSVLGYGSRDRSNWNSTWPACAQARTHLPGECLRQAMLFQKSLRQIDIIDKKQSKFILE